MLKKENEPIRFEFLAPFDWSPDFRLRKETNMLIGDTPLIFHNRPIGLITSCQKTLDGFLIRGICNPRLELVFTLTKEKTGKVLTYVNIQEKG